MDVKITEVTAKEAKSLRTEIKKVVEARQKNSLGLCRLIYTASFTEVVVGGEAKLVWELWGYDTWDEFIGMEFGLYPTTAYVYRKIWYRFYVEFAGCWDSDIKLSITRLRILSADGTLTKRNVNARMKRAAKKTCSQLAAEVFGVEELRHFGASMSDDELKLVNKAIDTYRSALGEEDDDGKKIPRGQALAAMCREWVNIQSKLPRTSRGKLRLVS